VPCQGHWCSCISNIYGTLSIEACGMGAYVMSHICVGVGSGFISGVMSRSLVFVYFKHIRHAFDRGMGA